MPIAVMETRKKMRRLTALAKDALFIDHAVKPKIYYYIEGDKLRILKGEKEAIADKIEVIHGKKAALVSALELGHPYLELPAEVTEKFESIIWEKEIKKLALIHVQYFTNWIEKSFSFIPISKYFSVKCLKS